MRLTTVTKRGEPCCSPPTTSTTPPARSAASSCRRRSARTGTSTDARSPGPLAGTQLDRPPARVAARRAGGAAPRRGGPRAAPAHAGRRAGRAPRARAGRAERAGRGPQPLVGPGLRPRARRPRAAGLRRRDHARGVAPDRRAAACWRGLFHESDLLVAECLHAGSLDGLDAARLAGLLSTFVYEHRSPEPPPPPWFPSTRCAAAMAADRRDRARTSPPTSGRPGWPCTVRPIPASSPAAYAWVAGEGFAEVVEDEELTGGDFVRTMKQLIDLARQLALVGARRRDPRGGAGGRPSGRSAAWSPTAPSATGRRRRRRPSPTVTIRPGEDVGRAGPSRRPARRRRRPTPSWRRTSPRRPTRARCALARRRPPAHARRSVRRAGLAPPDRRRCASTPTAASSLAVAHVVAARPDSWWRGRIVAVMNADHVGSLGRRPAGPSRTTAGPTSSRSTRRWAVRARWQAWRRLPTGTHVPHPAITRERVTAAAWTFDRAAAAVARRRRRAAPYARSRSPSRPTAAVRPHADGGPVEAWILDESPGRVPVGRDRPAAARPPTTCASASSPARSTTWTCGSPAACRKPPLPHVPGCDVAGVVEAVGDAVDGLAVGDEVVVNPACRRSTTSSPSATTARWAPGSRSTASTRGAATPATPSAPARNVVARPASRTWEESAAYPLASLTAYRMLRRARLRPARRCSSSGIGSGVSCAALAIARHLGAEVVATSRSEAKRAEALAMGAAAAIDSADDRWPVQADVVVESVGPATWDKSVRALKAGGRLVVCGGTSGAEVDAQPAPPVLQAVSRSSARRWAATRSSPS